jgi:hypothetical protein
MPPSPAPSPAGAAIVSPAQFRVLQRARARMLHPAGSARSPARFRPPAGGKEKQMQVHDLFTPAWQKVVVLHLSI